MATSWSRDDAPELRESADGIGEKALPRALADRLIPVVLDLFSAQDFHQVNVRDIYKESGVSPSTIYRYFDTKEDLVFSILCEKMQEIAVDVRREIEGVEGAREMMRRVFWVTLDYYDRNPGVAVTAFITIPMRSWMRSRYYTETARDVNSVILDIHRQGIAQGEIDPVIRPLDMSDQYFMNCFRQIHKWHFHGMERSLTSELDSFFPLVWKVISRCEPSRA